MKRTFVICIVMLLQYDFVSAQERTLGTLMSKKDDEAWRAIMPKFSDERIAGVMSHPNTIFYTDKELPKAYQDFDGVSALHGVHDPMNNVSADKAEPFGNGNREFPWRSPFGLDKSNVAGSVRFINLPLDEEGKRLPVVWWMNPPLIDKRVLSQASNGYGWIFPIGTVIGEALFMTDSNGKKHIFEVRVRTRGEKRWTVDAFRPFVTSKELQEAVRRHWPANGREAQLSGLLEHLDRPLVGEPLLVVNKHPDSTVFKQERLMDVLPDIGEGNAIKLLSNAVFSSALGADWRNEERSPHAPSTKAKFNVVPQNYDGGLVAVDSKSCMQCHDNCNKHVRDFHFKRDWYGRIRGSDGIFSWHIFDQESISKNGSAKPVVINKKMATLKIVERYDPKKHPGDIYSRINGLN